MPQPKRSRFFFGWIIVAIATFALLISNGLSIGGLPVFYKPIQEDLLRLGTVSIETKDAVTGYGAGLTFLLAGISSFFFGWFIRRLGLRWLMAGGCVVLGGALVFYSIASSPSDIYISHSALGLSLGLVGVTIQTVLISNWFRRKRGTAMGILLAGTSLGGVLVPLIATPLIASYGWRTAMQLLSLTVWLLLLPAILFLVRDRASDSGLNFDGEDVSEAQAGEAKQPLTGLTFTEALRSPMFWIVALCAVLIFYPIFTISQQFILYLQNTVGLSRETASFAQSVLFAMSLCGKLVFGWLCDKFPTRIVIMACCGLMFLSTVMLLGFLTPSTIFVFLVPFGLGYGGTFVLVQLLAVESFGLRDIGKILGALTMIETFGGYLGSVITGKLAAASRGDYTVAFYGVTIAAGLAFLSTFAIYLGGRKRQAGAFNVGNV
ncbi:MAG: MFS transporter [Pyrinomonadaceae bacterium]